MAMTGHTSGDEPNDSWTVHPADSFEDLPQQCGFRNGI